MRSLKVDLRARGYSIHIGTGALTRFDLLKDALSQRERAVVVSDHNVAPLYCNKVTDALRRFVARVDVLTIPAGEESKSLNQATVLWEKFLDLAADRGTLVVVVGGGVVGDLAGFVAATYARGLDWIQLPTTLLAQVDSSVGGKVGVNLTKAKNLVGAIWQPRGVLIDVSVLDTLDDREYRAGLAEVVKYGVAVDANFFGELESRVEQLNRRDPAVLEDIVAKCCRFKADIVEQDERETTGKRAILNYGHTFGHAIESVTGYGRFLHGEAVAIGMCCAARLARQLGRVNQEFVERQQALLLAFRLPVAMPNLPGDKILAAMRRDKKTSSGQICLVLPTRIGHVGTVANVDDDFILRALID